MASMPLKCSILGNRKTDRQNPLYLLIVTEFQIQRDSDVAWSY